MADRTEAPSEIMVEHDERKHYQIVREAEAETVRRMES